MAMSRAPLCSRNVIIVFAEFNILQLVIDGSLKLSQLSAHADAWLILLTRLFAPRTRPVFSSSACLTKTSADSLEERTNVQTTAVTLSIQTSVQSLQTVVNFTTITVLLLLLLFSGFYIWCTRLTLTFTSAAENKLPFGIFILCYILKTLSCMKTKH